MKIGPGSLVEYREREWVVLPSEDSDVLLLRPIGGSSREICGVLKPLSDTIAYSLGYERVKPAQFPLPDSNHVQDLAAVRMTLDAARLLLREGAAPFRSLGRLSIRPRPYQFVPLLMALRMKTVRLLISDDVGIGKTIEAALIARELLDRGDIRRFAVLCPPYLCDQWQKELAEKFHIDAVVIRSGTVSRLERLLPPDKSIFGYFPFFVASIDLVKGERYNASFRQWCPELLLVDEIHGAAQPPGKHRSRAQQQRHELLKKLASDYKRHMVLLSATPHSGVEETFASILGLLKPEFARISLGKISETELTELARHFVQRRRADVRHWMGEDTPFPDRDTSELDQPYSFSPEYRAFYENVYGFARDVVRSAESLTGWKRRMRFWSALALLRCITSSPAAAHAALEKRTDDDDVIQRDVLEQSTDEELDATFEPVVHDPSEGETIIDAAPSSVFDAQEADPDWTARDRKKLREFVMQAAKLRGRSDTKLRKLVDVLAKWLREGFHPIVWCRYIATSEYVAEALEVHLGKQFRDLRVTSINGTVHDDERRLKVEELSKSPRRILVATDCLSEGVNLQDHFNGIIHYDLPWNPNRLEQREGRVDRFGQESKTVKAAWIYGQDSPVDGAVLEVLLRKARDIHRALGVHVPVPIQSETVMEAVMRSLFSRPDGDQLQLSLFDGSDDASEMKKQYHGLMEHAADREKQSRTRFAQRAIKPEEVEKELRQTDEVLGDPGAVQSFLEEASQRMSFGFRKARLGKWELRTKDLPDPVLQRISNVTDPWYVTFDSPTPPDLAYVGRNHPLIEGLAEYVLDIAFYPPDGDTPASRCGVIRSNQVDRRTTLLLLRLRFLLYERGDGSPTLAEETLTWGFSGVASGIQELGMHDARSLLNRLEASGNVTATEKRKVLDETLSCWKDLQPRIGRTIEARRIELEESHRRIRSVLQRKQVRFEPHLPPDLLGIVVVLPVPGGVTR